VGTRPVIDLHDLRYKYTHPTDDKTFLDIVGRVCIWEANMVSTLKLWRASYSGNHALAYYIVAKDFDSAMWEARKHGEVDSLQGFNDSRLLIADREADEFNKEEGTG